MKRLAIAALSIFVAFLFAGCGGGAGHYAYNPFAGPYPLGFEGTVKMKVQAMQVVRPGQTTKVAVHVENDSDKGIINHDVTLTLLNSPDGMAPLNNAPIKDWQPAVDFDPGNRPDWLTGALRSGQGKNWIVTVQLPKHMPNSASRWCFVGYVNMYNAKHLSSWSDQSNESCAAIVR